MTRKFKLTMGESATDKWWHNSAEIDLDSLSVLLNKGTERQRKDGPCFIPGSLLGGQRKAVSVEFVDMLVYDIDGGQEMEGPGGILERIEALNVKGFGYTTYSHLSTVTEVSANKIEAYCKKTKKDFPLRTAAEMQPFLDTIEKGHLTNIVFDLDADKKKFFVHDKDGTRYRIHHDAVKKFRLAFPLQHRIMMEELGDSDSQNVSAYKSIYHGVGRALGLGYDHTCEDPCRLYYFPSFKPGHAHEAQYWEFGDEGASLLDHRSFSQAKANNQTGSLTSKSHKGARGHSEDVTSVVDRDGQVVNLVEFARHNPDFDIEELLRSCLSAENVRNERGGKPGFSIECPYEQFHSQPGGDGTFAANADGDNSWMIYCSHASCRGAERTRLDMLAEYIRSGHIVVDDLESRAVDPKAAIIELATNLSPTSGDEEIGAVLDKLVAGDHDPLFEERVRLLICERLNKKAYKFEATLKESTKLRRIAFKASLRSAMSVSDNSGKLVLLDWETNGVDANVVRARVRDHFEKVNRETPRVFKRGVHPVALAHDSTTQQVMIQPLTCLGMAAEIEGVVSFRKSTQDGETIRHVECPPSMADKIRLCTELELPVLIDVKHTPYFTADGQLVIEPGYHASAGIFYQPAVGLVIPEVPNVPDNDEVAKAKALVLMPLQGFPFSDTEATGQPSLENAIAVTLTQFVREMTGAVPMYAIDKPDHGVGGTLLAKVISRITTGAGPAVETVKPNTEEWTKSFHSHALAGTHQILIDNVPMGYTIEDTTLAATATGDRMTGRILGKTEIGGGDVRWIVTFTGVNVKFSKENARRAIITRLDAKMSDPCSRSDFAIPQLERWVSDHRGELIWAYLVLTQNWIAKGKPAYSGVPLANFDPWSNVVGGILECAGMTAFNTNRYLLEGADAAGIQEFLQAMLDTFGESWVPPGKKAAHEEHRRSSRHLADLYASMDDDCYLGVVRKAADYETLGARLGTKLSTYVGRVVRLETKRYSGWATSHDFTLRKEKRNTGAVYGLERVPNSPKYFVVDAAAAEAAEAAMREAIREGDAFSDAEAEAATEAAILEAHREADVTGED